VALVRLPKNCTFAGLAAALTQPEAWKGDLDALTLFMPRGTFLEAASVAFLCIWGLQQLAAGRRLALPATRTPAVTWRGWISTVTSASRPSPRASAAARKAASCPCAW